MNWMNLCERAAWTFVEAFLVALPSTINMELPAAGWLSALLAAACAGLSALKTLLVELVGRRLAEMEDEGEPMEKEKAEAEAPWLGEGEEQLPEDAEPYEE